jgi:hypothetical protein
LIDRNIIKVVNKCIGQSFHYILYSNHPQHHRYTSGGIRMTFCPSTPNQAYSIHTIKLELWISIYIFIQFQSRNRPLRRFFLFIETVLSLLGSRQTFTQTSTTLSGILALEWPIQARPARAPLAFLPWGGRSPRPRSRGKSVASRHQRKVLRTTLSYLWRAIGNVLGLSQGVPGVGANRRRDFGSRDAAGTCSVVFSERGSQKGF